MNKKLKIGLSVLATGVLMRILAEIMWPIVKPMNPANPQVLGLLAILGILIFVGPLCLLIGFILSLMGFIQQQSKQ